MSHLVHLNQIKAMEFADCLSYDCLHNPYNKLSSNCKAYIDPNASAQPVQSSAHVGDSMDDYIQRQVCIQLQEVNDMSSIASNLISPLSVTFVCEVSLGIQGFTDTPKANSINARSVERHYVICSYDTRYMCNNWKFKLHVQSKANSDIKGTPICKQVRTIGALLKRFPQNGTEKKSCMQLHREQCQAKLLEEAIA